MLTLKINNNKYGFRPVSYALHFCSLVHWLSWSKPYSFVCDRFISKFNTTERDNYLHMWRVVKSTLHPPIEKFHSPKESKRSDRTTHLSDEVRSSPKECKGMLQLHRSATLIQSRWKAASIQRRVKTLRVEMSRGDGDQGEDVSFMRVQVRLHRDPSLCVFWMRGRGWASVGVVLTSPAAERHWTKELPGLSVQTAGARWRGRVVDDVWMKKGSLAEGATHRKFL